MAEGGDVLIGKDAQASVQALAARGLPQHRVTGGRERQIGEGLGVELFPVALAMAELVGDDVRLEEPGILEDRDVAGEDIANAQRGGPGETRNRETAHLHTGPHVLAGDRGDIARQVPVDPDGRLSAGQP